MFILSFDVISYLLVQRLLHELLRKLDAELKHEVCHWAAYYVSALGILFFISALELVL